MQSFYLDGCKKSKQTDLKDEALQQQKKKEMRKEIQQGKHTGAKLAQQQRTTTASSTKTKGKAGLDIL